MNIPTNSYNFEPILNTILFDIVLREDYTFNNIIIVQNLQNQYNSIKPPATLINICQYLDGLYGVPYEHFTNKEYQSLYHGNTLSKNTLTIIESFDPYITAEIELMLNKKFILNKQSKIQKKLNEHISNLITLQKTMKTQLIIYYHPSKILYTDFLYTDLIKDNDNVIKLDIL